MLASKADANISDYGPVQHDRATLGRYDPFQCAHAHLPTTGGAAGGRTDPAPNGTVTPRDPAARFHAGPVGSAQTGNPPDTTAARDTDAEYVPTGTAAGTTRAAAAGTAEERLRK